jgi:uncharacterized protein involved in response to NO
LERGGTVQTIFEKPIWFAGFRPLFSLAMFSGALLPLAWALVFSGRIELPRSSLPPIQWHAHEMSYGFGWAVLGGFLLTASKNWVKIRGIHGAALAWVTFAWCLERIAVYFADEMPSPLRFAVLNAYLLSCGGYVVYSLWRYRHQDTFKDNYFFLVGIPLFLAAKNLMLTQATYAYGVGMTVGLFRLAFAVMFERTTSQFMKNAMSTVLPKYPALDTSIKLAVLASAFSVFLPPQAAAAFLALTAALMTVRFFTWKPHVGLRNFGIALMYAGHFGLILHLWFSAAASAGFGIAVGALAIHMFTLLCMGIVIPGMLIRISQGHTGRPIAFTLSDRVAIAFMFGAAFFRTVPTQFWPQQYRLWISLSAAGWSICFAILAWRLIPFLFQPRIDGKPG